jgi:hypothetical protein
VTISGRPARTIPLVVDVRQDAPTMVEWLGAIGGSVLNQAAAARSAQALIVRPRGQASGRGTSVPGAGPLMRRVRGGEPRGPVETRADEPVRATAVTEPAEWEPVARHAETMARVLPVIERAGAVLPGRFKGVFGSSRRSRRIRSNNSTRDSATPGLLTRP